ncbi:amidase domain-containing protein [Laceyella putida]|uniref:Amidase domain-containing protein n=1 Tax=Laceyella putida TaxID=110101 RepID=A0ABW2RGV0_9BACL
MNRIMICAMMLSLIVSGCSSTDAQSGTKEQPMVQETNGKESDTAQLDEAVASTEPVKQSPQVNQSGSSDQPKVSTSNQKLLQKVNYYKKSDKKKPAPEQTALSAIKKAAQQHQVNVKPDVNDAKFREMVIVAATNIQSLTPAEAKAVTEYAKKVDAYENETKNKIIKNMEQRLKMGATLTEEEKSTLEALTPINPGQKLEMSSDMSGQGQGKQEKPNNKQPQQPQNEKPSQQPQQEKPGQQLQAQKTSNQYNPIAARDYAYKWWNKRNNKEYGYYSRVSGGCENCWPDCTNFVSQAIKAGGIQERRTGTYWYYSDQKPSYAWGVANSFYKHFKDRAQQVKDWKDLSVGDVVSIDFDHDGDIEHSAIITRIGRHDVYVTQHSSDKKDSPISPWLLAGYDVYAWKMSTANNK